MSRLSLNLAFRTFSSQLSLTSLLFWHAVDGLVIVSVLLFYCWRSLLVSHEWVRVDEVVVSIVAINIKETSDQIKNIYIAFYFILFYSLFHQIYKTFYCPLNFNLVQFSPESSIDAHNHPYEINDTKMPPTKNFVAKISAISASAKCSKPFHLV